MQRREVRRQWLANYEMLLVSIAANSLAPLLVTFQEQYNISITQSSLFPVFLAIGGILANFLGAIFIARLGVRKYNLIFLLCFLTTTANFYLANTPLLLYTAVFLLGFTTATGMAVTSTIISHLEIKRQNFGLYHASFGIGGIITPALIGLIFQLNLDYQLIFIMMAALALGTMLLLLKSDLLSNHTYQQSSFLKSLGIVKMPVVYLAMIMLIFYASSEMGTVLWSNNLFIQGFDFSKESSVMFLSGFWLVFTCGRIFTQNLEARWKFKRLILSAVLLVIFSLVLLLWTGLPLFFWSMALGMAPIFPTVQKYSMQHIPFKKKGLFNNLIYGLLGLGNVLLPALMGVLGGIKIQYAFIVPLCSMLIILAAFGRLVSQK